MKRFTLGMALLTALIVILGGVLMMYGKLPTGEGLNVQQEAPLADNGAAESPVQVASRLPLEPAADQSFPKLPFFEEFGVSDPAVALIATPPPSIYQKVLVSPRAPTAPHRALVPRDSSNHWLALPLLVGAIFIGSDSGGDDQRDQQRRSGEKKSPPSPPQVVPEPSTVALLSTGLLFVGLAAMRRRG